MCRKIHFPIGLGGGFFLSSGSQMAIEKQNNKKTAEVAFFPLAFNLGALAYFYNSHEKCSSFSVFFFFFFFEPSH